MSLVINTNIASLNAQRQLSGTQNMLDRSLERLSSGLRINSARDDAAGMAIADRMTSQIRGLNQAVRNANDGISFAQTGEGALQEATNILQRIRELAVQSANDTNTSSDRQKLQKEVGSLVSELDRIATSTQFNGRTIFDGNFGTATYQVGANANQTISASVDSFRTSDYGNNTFSGAPSAGDIASRTVVGAAIVVNGNAGSGTYTTQTNDTAKTIAEGINRLGTGVTASARTELDIGFTTTGTYALTVQSDNGTAKNISFSVGAGASGLVNAAKAFNDATGETGVTAQVNATGSAITLVNATGNDITLTDTTAVNSGDVTVGAAILTGAGGVPDTAVINGEVRLDSDKSFNATDIGLSGYTLDVASSTLQAVASFDVTSVSGATDAMRIADGALSSIDDQRAEFGALQNRFESTISNLQNVSENLSAARSRIQDADFAAETAALTRAQILQQAGVSILAQANQSQQSVLSLLR